VTRSPVKRFAWSSAKDTLCREQRNVGFADVVEAVAAGDLLDVLAHANPARYPRQRVLVVAIRGYAYLVPYVEGEEEYFLKTIIPSRKATKRYLSGSRPGTGRAH
jgi:uncharacterized DUF497 family protein